MIALTFWTVYVMLFVAGGFVTLFGLLPFRPAYASFLPLVLIPLGGLVVNRVALSMTVFALGVLLSALVNGSSIAEAMLFLRFVLTPYMMYYLASMYLTRQSIVPVLRISLFLGLMQVPVVLFQRIFYRAIMAGAANPVEQTDAYFGTFFTADDPA